MNTLQRESTCLILSPEDVTPYFPGCLITGIFNPGVAKLDDGKTVIVGRVSESTTEIREGFTALPRIADKGKLEVDWLKNEDDILDDPRKVIRRQYDLMRLKSLSYLRVFFSKDGKTIDREGPVILPYGENEKYGIEDPRISRIDGTYYLTYVSVSNHGASTSLMSTDDWTTFKRHGVIFPPENKDVVLHPTRINGEHVAYHRPNTFQRFCKPEIWLSYSKDLLTWGKHRPVYAGTLSWNNDRIGAGPPPIVTDQGIMMIYHGSRSTHTPGHVGEYCAGIIILDRNDPGKVLFESTGPFMCPEKEFERKGFVPEVVFPTGIVIENDLCLLYYGAADTHIAVSVYKINALLDFAQI